MPASDDVKFEAACVLAQMFQEQVQYPFKHHTFVKMHKSCCRSVLIQRLKCIPDH